MEDNFLIILICDSGLIVLIEQKTIGVYVVELLALL